MISCVTCGKQILINSIINNNINIKKTGDWHCLSNEIKKLKLLETEYFFSLPESRFVDDRSGMTSLGMDSTIIPEKCSKNFT